MKKRTVLRALRGYLVLALCMALLVLPLYLGTMTLFEKRQLALTRETLTSGLEQLDQQITGLSGIASSIGSEASYRTFASRSQGILTPGDYYNISNLHTEFRRLCMSQPYTADYGLLLKNRIIFTKERTHFPGDRAYGTFLRFGELDEEAFYETFGRLRGSSTFLPAMTVTMMRGAEEKQERYRAVVWLCSMSQMVTTQPYGVFFATLADTTLARLLMPELSDQEAGFTLYAKSGEELLSYGLDGDTAERPHILTSTAASSGLSVRLCLSDTLFTDMMSPIRNLLLAFLCGFVLVGVLLSALLAVRTSKPIRRLMALVSQTENAVSYQDGAKTDFDMIGNAVTGMSTSLKEYRAALSAQQSSVRDHVFEMILRETPVREGAASRRHLQEFAGCFPSFPGVFRLAVLAMHESEKDVETLPKRQVALRGLIETQLSPAPYALLSGHRAVVVLGGESGERWVEQLTQLRRVAREKLNIPLTVALTDEGRSPEALHALYEQAKGILALADAESEGSPVEVWQRRNFPDQPQVFPLDYTEMAQLHTLLLRGEKDAVLALLADVRTRLRTVSFMDEVMARQVFYNIRSVLLRVKMEKFDVLLSLDVPDYHGELSGDKLLGMLTECCVTICGVLLPLNAEKRTAFSSAVCRFIDEHLSDHALGARLVADRFGISEPTLQKVVRQEKGCSFFDYIEKMRYELALRYLTQTDLPVGKIAEQCGYNSPNSFYKAFKRVSDLPPAAVRQQARLRQEDP